MLPAFKLQCHFVLIFLAALRGETRYLELREVAEADPFLFFSTDLKRELSEEQLYRRSLRCIDMLSIEGQFTFTAEQPQLHCAAFFIGEPEEVISIQYDLVSIDCHGGDFLKVFDGWILKGEKFPSSQDHPLPMSDRYIDFCESGNIRSFSSSQNVAMIFFRIHETGNGFTITIKKNPNLFHPQWKVYHGDSSSAQKLQLLYHLSSGYKNIRSHIGAFKQSSAKETISRLWGIGDFVELLGGTGLDPSKMMPFADLCYPFHGPAQMTIGCDNTVVRMVSSGKHVNRVTFEYHQLEPYDLESPNGNSIKEYCFPSL